MAHDARFFLGLVVSVMVGACQQGEQTSDARPGATELVANVDALKLDPATGVPYASTFQFPIAGFDTSDFGFGFGAVNDHFCLQSATDGSCSAYGAHLARDTQVPKTPVGTEVFAPADGIVRISTNVEFGGYGSDTKSNPEYAGCVIVLEHEFVNGQVVTTLLGHLACENKTAYDKTLKKGNPSVGSVVQRGQYLAHVNHYWSGSSETLDWHHLHWGMRKGKYVAANQGDYVRGYAHPSEFMTDPVTQVKVHPTWVDPFTVVAANGDPAQQVDTTIRHHPPGSLLEDPGGGRWLVQSATEIRAIANPTFVADRYDAARVVKVAQTEVDCHAKGAMIAPLGTVTLYQRPGSSAVVMAYAQGALRYEVIRWEALLSWGFASADLTTETNFISLLEKTYAPNGFRRMRAGSLVKADEESEVAMVTPQQTRVPIASGEVFTALGFKWEQVVSIPKVVLDQVAGVRELPAIDLADIHACPVPAACPNGGNCGGGMPPEGNGGAGGAAGSSSNGPCEPNPCEIGYSCSVKNTVTYCSFVPTGMGGMSGMSGAAGAGGVPGSSGAGGVAGAAGSPPSTMVALQLSYVGPVMPGLIVMNAWWQPPMSAPRAWAPMMECVDALPGDGAFECNFQLPHGTTSLEWQLDLPDGRYWGDESCWPTGGCGQPIGKLTLSDMNGTPIVYEMLPNKPGEPYLKGHVAFIP